VADVSGHLESLSALAPEVESMNWSSARHRVAALVAASLPLFPSAAPALGLTDDPAPPNVLLVVMDDMTHSDLLVRKPNGDYAMPNVHALLKQQGVDFSRTHAPFPLCSPSRATFLTGQHAHNHGVMGNDLPHGGYTKLAHANTLPVWLQASGYYTLHLGKYLNGYAGIAQFFPYVVPEGWNEWYTHVNLNQNAYYNFAIDHNGALINFGNAPADYLSDVLTGKAREYLMTRPYGNRPFYMQVDYFAPHASGQSPAIPAPRHLGVMDAAPFAPAPAFNEFDVSDKPSYVRSTPTLSPAAISSVEQAFRRRVESLMAADDGIGAIIATLKDTGQYDNTFIVFTSDNGWQYGEHRLLNKQHAYAESTHIPLLVVGPGVPRGMTIDQLAMNVDYVPTILEWTKTTPGLLQDGRSLAQLIRNPSMAWRKEMPLENPHLLNYTGIRTYVKQTGEEWIYIEYDYGPFGVPDGTVDERELYDLTQDPHQLTSLHDDPTQAQRMQQMSRRLAQLRTCSGHECR